jgi:hypothetical protein
VTLPLALRNGLAALILESLHDASARRALHAIASLCVEPWTRERLRDLPPWVPSDLFEEHDGGIRVSRAGTGHAATVAERAGRAWEAIRDAPLDPPEATLPIALAGAARLFDAGLYFEVHELLEPYWTCAGRGDRAALQGLIQVAVGFQHLANGNEAGALALLRDGSEKAAGRRVCGVELDDFARGARACAQRIAAHPAGAAPTFDWTTVPRFPVKPRSGST